MLLMCVFIYIFFFYLAKYVLHRLSVSFGITSIPRKSLLSSLVLIPTL